jgi:hypothetical protein
MDGRLAPDLAAQDLDRPISQYFVGVHVGGRPGSRLEDVQHEVDIQVSVHHLLRRLPDRSRELGIEEFQFLVHFGRGALDRREGVEEPTVEAKSADRKVLTGPLSLRSIQHVRRDADGAHRVHFLPVF